MTPMLVGSSQVMVALRATIKRFAPTDLPVLIEGPTGSGKELVATALHAESGRAGPFVPFNVCAIPDSMFEDALFGHVRGAFTGAISDSEGLLKEANNGTLFLDEVSGLSIANQMKLLRVFETGTYRPVGAARDDTSQFRIVAASNENLVQLVTQRQFRTDLLFRIRALVIRVPSLAERMDDLPLLVEHFVSQIGGIDRTMFSAQAISRLERHSWPGNVRELKHIVERIVLMSDGGTVGFADVDAALEYGYSTTEPGVVHAAEYATLYDLLDRHSWDTESAARELGVHRATVYRRMQRCGLMPARRRMR